MIKVCVVTGTRAEYGLLKPLIGIISRDAELELQLIVTGMHLSPEFGLTYKDIEKDGFLINDKIEMLVNSDTAVGISKSMGLCIIGFSDSLERLKPDLIIILGDRFEIYSAAIAAMVANTPIAHIHGGETGAGTIDNMIRHAITKMSFLHFTSTDAYRKRVIQLGEQPDNVFNIGSLGVENIKKIKLLSKATLEEAINFHIDNNTILFTFHPLSLEPHLVKEQFNEILSAFDEIKELRIIFTKSNADTGGRIINQMIDEYVSMNTTKSTVFASLGTLKYLSAVKYVKAVVGNSSSGIIEVPSLGTYTLNIGKRQAGRIQCESIINCEATKEDVLNNLNLLIKKPKLDHVYNPYEKQNTAQNIINIIKDKLNNKSISTDKKFYDVNSEN